MSALSQMVNTRAPTSPKGGSKAPRGLMSSKPNPSDEALDHFKNVLLGTKLNILLVFIPFAMVSHSLDMGDGPTFTLSLLALCPLAERWGSRRFGSFGASWQLLSSSSITTFS